MQGMKLYKILIIIMLLLVLQGCNKNEDITDIIDFATDEVNSINILVTTPEETERLQVSDKEGLKEVVTLLQSIQIKGRLEEPEPATTYYDYTLYLSDGSSYRLTDYGNRMKVINLKGDTNWYGTDSNTWESVTPLWQKYATAPEEDTTPDKSWSDIPVKKPVIYIYPTETSKVDVSLDLEGELTYSYPSYNNGWSVIASPDGTLTDPSKGTQYSYLFWEGITEASYDMSQGFVVKGEEVTTFLEDKLTFLGLNEKERNDFIVYWAPQLAQNSYNLITFQDTDYTEKAKLSISPEPDTLIRIFMVYQPLSTFKEIPKQKLSTRSRTGFTVVEWGGAEL